MTPEERSLHFVMEYANGIHSSHLLAIRAGMTKAIRAAENEALETIAAQFEEMHEKRRTEAFNGDILLDPGISAFLGVLSLVVAALRKSKHPE